MLFSPSMRLMVTVLSLALWACSSIGLNPVENGAAGGGSGSGSGGAAECSSSDDCALAAAACCECPQFAVPTSDPSYTGCLSVSCSPAPSCPNNVAAVCQAGQCALECVQMACPTSCSSGYTIDASTGCLSCTCADNASPQCSVDSDCVRTRADCCGCLHGGQDTSVPVSEQASFDASLDCPSDPSCPSADTCAADLLARCIEGECELAPATPANACGNANLPACQDGQQCTINVDAAASAQGVGICM